MFFNCTRKEEGKAYILSSLGRKVKKKEVSVKGFR